MTEFSAANFCLANRYQNGDLDFDGTSYQSFTWPNGSRNHPTAFEYAGPFQANGKPYPQIQFETDVGGVGDPLQHHDRCGLHRPADRLEVLPVLVAQPAALGARVARLTSCVWNFGNVLPRTFQTFGKDAQYGTPDVARFAGTLASTVQANPEVSGVCAGPI